MTKLQSCVVDQYLQIRRSLGYTLEREGHLLPDFISFLDAQNASHITSDLAVQWANASTTAGSRHRRLAIVRQFAKFASTLDLNHEVPAKSLLPQPTLVKLIPYVYSDDDVKCLIHKTAGLQGLKANTYATLLGLLYSTGMRVGEVISLNRSDINWQQGLLTIHHSKFDKSRQLPLHSSTITALRQYSDLRDSCLSCLRSPSFLISLSGTRLHYKNVHKTFIRLIRDSYLNEQQPHRPRLHDFRHSFAINTLTRWYREGLDVEPLLPCLSTYLGHVSPSSTYWYLSATPPLLEAAAQRLEHTVGVLP